MKPFEKTTSVITPIVRINIDTDQIIPKQFLKLVSSSGFGDYLFYGWRFNPDGSNIESFPLNNPAYRDSKILLAGANFGCGSSREHAVWALRDYGFNTVIAPSFADIFKGNCTKNGLLPIELDMDMVRILEKIQTPITVDLESLTVSTSSQSWRFKIGSYEKRMLIEGLDEIDITLGLADQIDAYERTQRNCVL